MTRVSAWKVPTIRRRCILPRTSLHPHQAVKPIEDFQQGTLQRRTQYEIRATVRNNFKQFELERFDKPSRQHLQHLEAINSNNRIWSETRD